MTAMRTARATARSEDELLAGCTGRTPMAVADGLSNVPMERLVRDGEPLVVKWLSSDLDWVARFSGDRTCRPLVLWESGLYDDIAPHVDHAVVGACRDEATGRAGLLMRDLGPWFVPEGAHPFTTEQNDVFLRSMAALHTGFWGWRDELGLCTDTQRYSIFSDATLAQEASLRPLTGVPALVAPAWELLSRLVPATADPVRRLLAEPGPLVDALAETPRAFVHTDWKGGNLGLLPAGRTVLVDWAMPGEGAPCGDLAWYLAVNCDRLPVSKEVCITTYRDALESQGIPTGDWFARQLELALVGAFCQLGWSKTQDPVELGWWVERVTPVAVSLL